MKSLGSPVAVAVAELLKKTRRRAKVSQKKLAARLKWDPAKIILIEKGQQQVKVAEFVAMFEVLGEDPVEALRQALQLRDQGAGVRLKKKA